MGPLLVVEPVAVGFGAQDVGRNAPDQQVVMRNPGDRALDVYSIEVLDAAQGFIIGSVGGGQRIRAGSAGSFVVRLRPDRPGAYSTNVAIRSNATDEPMLIPVTAMGVAPSLEAEPALVRVGAQTPSAVVVSLRNPGTAVLSLEAFEVAGDAGFALDLAFDRNGDLPWDLESVDEATGRPVREVTVSWDPALADGDGTGELRIASTSWDAPFLVVPLFAEP